MVRGETDKTADNIQARSFMAKTTGENTIMQENFQKKIIDPEDKEFRKTIKNAPAMSARTTRIFGMVKNPIKSNQNLRVLWKVVNLQDCVWENLYRTIMKTIIQKKETIHHSITIWLTYTFLCLKT